MKYVQYATVPVALLLNILLIHVLLKNAKRTYVLLTLCAMVMLLSTVVETAAMLGAELTWTHQTQRYYWMPELLLESMIFATVILMCVQRSRERNSRQRWARWLVGASVVYVVLSVLWLYNPIANQWFTLVSRNLGFGAMLLNVLLWGSLLPDPSRDLTMLRVSGALGVNLAGQAGGQSFRHLWEVSKSFVQLGNLLMVATHLTTLYLLWQAFRLAAEPAAEIRPQTKRTIQDA